MPEALAAGLCDAVMQVLDSSVQTAQYRLTHQE